MQFGSSRLGGFLPVRFQAADALELTSLFARSSPGSNIILFIPDLFPNDTSEPNVRYGAAERDKISDDARRQPG